MRISQIIATLTIASLSFCGACKSRHEEGVKSNLRTQWTEVAADTRATTTAAESVLKDEGLKDVSSESTNIDGRATGKMADGTKVTVTVAKKTESSSQVSVNVGTLGDPKLGAEMAKRIRDRAVSSSPSTESR